jgi:hypothetical protein
MARNPDGALWLMKRIILPARSPRHACQRQETGTTANGGWTLAAACALFLFSVEDALLTRQSYFKGWNLMVRCQALAPPRPEPLFAAFMSWGKCRKCRSRPSAAMLTNARDVSRVFTWSSREGGRGIVQILLWVPRNG